MVYGVGRTPSARLPSVRGAPGLRMTELSSFNAKALLRAASEVAPDVVFHLASAGVRDDDRDPRALLAGSVGLLVEVLDACRWWRPTKIIFTGSCSEYGPVRAATPVTEDSRSEPLEVYGAAKAAARLYGRALAERYGLPLLALRIFGTYGPGEGPERLIPYLSSKLRAGCPVDLTPGEQTRDMTFVDDVAKALSAAARSADLGDSGTFNVCSGRGVTVRQLCLEVARQLGASERLLEFGARPYRPGEAMWLVGDPSAFRQKTGWQPQVTLTEGVSCTLAALAEG